MSTKTNSRRHFLKVAGITLAAATVTCSGLGAVAAYQPAIETPDYQYGKEQTMNKRILVTYATRAGSTVGVASAIGETLSQRGFEVDVRPIKENPTIEGYQSVIIGSAVRMGNWLPEAVEYIKSHQETLASLPVAVFCVHLMNSDEAQNGETSREAYLNSVRALIKPADEAYFAGAIDPSKLSFADRLITKMVKSPIGDFRDWDKIRGWAEKIFA